MSVYGLNSLKLVFLCSVAVSFVQILLYRTIVLNAKYIEDGRYPWKLQSRDTENANFSKESEHVLVTIEEKSKAQINLQFEGNPKACKLHVELPENRRFPKMTSNLSDWSYTKRQNCPALKIEDRIKTTRMKFEIMCEKSVVSANLIPSNSTSDIQRLLAGSNCLKMFVQKCCSDSLPVPNVVHYVWYSKKEFSFFEFTSFMSVLRFVRPCAIFIHGDVLPSGNYWKFIVNMYPNIVHVVRIVKTTLFDKKVHYKEHNGNVWRLQALLRFGGIYMDTDTLVVKPIEPLRSYPCTLSRQSTNLGVSSSFMMAERNATFIREWLDWYKINYVNDSYSYNAIMFPSHLANRKPWSVHIENGAVYSSEGEFREVIFNANTDWSTIYGLHLLVKSFSKYPEFVNDSSVKYFNTTVGAICRHILFGNKELCI